MSLRAEGSTDVVAKDRATKLPIWLPNALLRCAKGRVIDSGQSSANVEAFKLETCR